MSDPEETESLTFQYFLSNLDEESKYRYRERVAILVFDGGATRQDAEAWVMAKAKEQLNPCHDQP